MYGEIKFVKINKRTSQISITSNKDNKNENINKNSYLRNDFRTKNSYYLYTYIVGKIE